MSNDLISRKVLIDSMDKRYKEKVGIVPDNFAEGFHQMEKLITEQPTAYELEIVIEQLEKMEKLAYESHMNCNSDTTAPAYMCYLTRYQEIGRCLEIVKSGKNDTNDKNGEWIPCSERLPEEKINPITSDYQEYCVTFSDGEVFDTRHYKFGKGHWWNYGKKMDKYVIAWQPLPEPFKG